MLPPTNGSDEFMGDTTIVEQGVRSAPTAGLPIAEPNLAGGHATPPLSTSRSFGRWSGARPSSSAPMSRLSRRGSGARELELDPASQAVQDGLVGGDFSPFPRSSTFSTTGAHTAFTRRGSTLFSDSVVDFAPLLAKGYNSPDMGSVEGFSDHVTPSGSMMRLVAVEKGLLWEKENAEDDDWLHEPDPVLDRYLDKQRTGWSFRGLFDTMALALVLILILGLFAGWPIYTYVIDQHSTAVNTDSAYWNITGQYPSVNVPGLIDADTPVAAYTRTGFDGEKYKLVFSDEFNIDGRTFWPGDDPYWEAVDLWYWQTQDMERYDIDQVVTANGSLVITLDQDPLDGLNFRSGMLQSWNKFCFTGGWIEMNVSLPGTANTQGYWPGLWTMGNLGRAGYGGSLEGVWPYTYDTCDVGTLPNQTWPNGTLPTAAKTSGSVDYGGELSWLPGQRFSACTCSKDKAEHPGPNVNVGRGAPEIDILESQIAPNGKQGSASQSLQFAPMDAGYTWLNTTPYIKTWNTTYYSDQNQWHGSIYQESASMNSYTDATSYEGAGWTTYGFEYDPGDSGRVTWAINGSETWEFTASAFPPNNQTQIGQRLISKEPMSIVINLAISEAFQTPQWGKLTFPGHLRIDYVRVYQKGTANIGCDPSDMPTADYIANHPVIYQNANLTTFTESNYTKPGNSLSASGC